MHIGGLGEISHLLPELCLPLNREMDKFIYVHNSGYMYMYIYLVFYILVPGVFRAQD